MDLELFCVFHRSLEVLLEISQRPSQLLKALYPTTQSFQDLESSEHVCAVTITTVF